GTNPPTTAAATTSSVGTTTSSGNATTISSNGTDAPDGTTISLNETTVTSTGGAPGTTGGAPGTTGGGVTTVTTTATAGNTTTSGGTAPTTTMSAANTTTTGGLDDGDLPIPTPRHVGTPARVLALNINLNSVDLAKLEGATVQITLSARDSARRLYVLTDLDTDLASYWVNVTHANSGSSSPIVRSVDVRNLTSTTIELPVSMLYKNGNFATKLYLIGTTQFNATQCAGGDPTPANNMVRPPENDSTSSNAWRSDITGTDITAVNFKINVGSGQVTTTTQDIIIEPAPGYNIFDMHTHPNLDALEVVGGGISTSGQISLLPYVIRGTAGGVSGTPRVLEVDMTPPRTITTKNRGTSLGTVQFRLDDIPTRANHKYEFFVKGTIGTTSQSSTRAMLRNGNDSNATNSPELINSSIGAGGAFSLLLSRDVSQITADKTKQGANAVYALANTSSTTFNAESNVVVTDMKITEVCPENCLVCVARTITFNANGGTVSPTSAKTHPSTGKLDSIPVPKRSGYRFVGWFTASTGGTRITSADHVFTADITLHARWVQHGDIQNTSAEALIDSLGLGWNLGNTFDCYESSSARYDNPIPTFTGDLETKWLQNSGDATSEALIKSIHDQGFDVIRVPVSWHKVISGDYKSSSFTLSSSFVERVKTVVDWAYDSCTSCNESTCPIGAKGMTVILNVHHDNYIHPFRTESETVQTITTITRLWNRICQTFNNDYNERLIFEVQNEPRIIGSESEWAGGGPRDDDDSIERRERVNRINQAAVNAIRATAGNNRYRILMIPTHGATASSSSSRDAFDGFKKPTDISANAGVNKMVLSIHSYAPVYFTGASCLCGASTTSACISPGCSLTNHSAFVCPETTGGVCRHLSPSWELSSITSMMNTIEDRAKTLQMPIVMGEFGGVARGSNGSTDDKIRVDWAKAYVTEAAARGIVPVWWDTGAHKAIGQKEGRYGLFNRNGGTVAYSSVIQAMKEGLAAGRARR
ncbi:MAG: cellulase family glycosylhydrolase, partial [Oscillospiraceae bacterium]|nr:cellulase family glycosylhydrolase [Oscillospiraceae bacterium]